MSSTTKIRAQPTDCALGSALSRASGAKVCTALVLPAAEDSHKRVNRPSTPVQALGQALTEPEKAFAKVNNFTYEQIAKYKQFWKSLPTSFFAPEEGKGQLVVRLL